MKKFQFSDESHATMKDCNFMVDVIEYWLTLGSKDYHFESWNVSSRKEVVL